MNLTRFSRGAALALCLLSSGGLFAANQSDDLPVIPKQPPARQAFLIAVEEPTQPLAQRAFLIANEDPTQQKTDNLAPQQNTLLSAIEKQRDEALQKTREGKDLLAQQAQEMADLMDQLNTPTTPQLVPQGPQPSVSPQAKAAPTTPQASTPVPRPVVSDIAIPESARGYEDIYRRFLGGKLIYTDPTSKVKKELLIRALANPLEGTFDLSGCGDTGQYLSISTGYRKAQKPENANKVEIWLAPWFLVNKNLSATAKHLQPIMGSWDASDAPVGLFWMWGGWGNLDYYDYLTTNSMDVLGSEDLLEKYKKSAARTGPPPHPMRALCVASLAPPLCGAFALADSSAFHVSFLN